MAKHRVFFTGVCIAALGILFLGQNICNASCEAECEVPKSCLNYSECRTAHVQCLAACKEKEAWDFASKSYEKTVEIQSKLIKHLEDQNVALERLLTLIDSLITKITKMNPGGEDGQQSHDIFAVAGSAVAFGGIGDIDQVVAHAQTFDGCRFGGTDVEAAVDLPRVAADDLGVKRFGDEDPHGGLSGGRGAAERVRPRCADFRCA